MLQQLVTHTQQWDWAVVSCQTRIFTRFSTAITLAFLKIFGMEWVATILEKNLDSQVWALGPGSSEIPRGCCRNLGLSLVSPSTEQLKSLQWMDEEDSCLTSAAEEFCPAYEPGVRTFCRVRLILLNAVLLIIIIIICCWLYIQQ